MIIIKIIKILFKKMRIRRIILIIMIMIIRNQKLVSLTRYFLLSTYIIFIKRFINFVLNSFNISNKTVKKKFREGFEENFRFIINCFFLKIKFIVIEAHLRIIEFVIRKSLR